ncbi:SMYD3 [Symbiodinium sp. CCMP2456]|nr:SMYD3 [Symbiodinium sp. CCMP2456]
MLCCTTLGEEAHHLLEYRMFAGMSAKIAPQGSLSGAFATLDITGEGEVRLPGFRAALLQFGDLNLTDEQVNKLWKIAQALGGCKDEAMDFMSFKTVFGPSAVEAPGDAGDGEDDAARAAKRDPGPSLEESCFHLYRLQRTEVLRAAIFRSAPEVFLPLELLSAAVREAAPELSDDEVSQVCRLAFVVDRGSKLLCQVPAMCTEIDWDRVWQEDFSAVKEFFHACLEVRSSQESGRGVWAAGPLRVGELLVAERALGIAPEAELGPTLAKMQSDLAPLDWKRLNLMCDGEELPTFSDAVPLPAWPSQAYPLCPEQYSPEHAISVRRMSRIVDLNAYRCASPVSEYAFTDGEPQRSEQERHESYGVFPLASLFNHTCAPNMSKVLLKDWVLLRAARDIEAGEELTQFYCDIRMPVEMRQKELQDLFGFLCGCQRCRFELLLQKTEQDLEPWRRLYSSEVPGFHQKLGPIQVSQLEGLVCEAETAARKAFKSLEREHSAAAESWESWLLWPLVPAFQQLAARLRLDGRRAESMEFWKRAESFARAVVPLSNIHLHIHAEMLLTKCSKELLEESLRMVAAAFGGGSAVWQRLFGFRMTREVAELADVCSSSLMPEPSPIHYQWVRSANGTSELLTLWSTAFQRQSEIVVDVSPEVVIVSAPGALQQTVRCHLKARVDSILTKFSKRRRCLTLHIPMEPDSTSEKNQSARDAYSYGHLLERLENDKKDFHPLNLRERGPAADMCRYIDQRLQAQGFVSLASAMQDAEVLRADILLDRLLNYLPQPIRPEDQRVVENMLRLGRPLRDGMLDAAEFCQRFELLARNGAVAGREPVAPVSPSRSARDARLQLREKVRLPSAWLACPRSWASRMLGRNRGRSKGPASREPVPPPPPGPPGPPGPSEETQRPPGDGRAQ